jgi:uncharacterized protein (DUF427 family)
MKSSMSWFKRIFEGQQNNSNPGTGQMARAVWNGQVIAESDQTVVVEGNHYFPPDSVRREFLKDSATTSFCAWKGMANYYTLEVNGQTNHDAAWYYLEPKKAAHEIQDRLAFWHGVKVSS